MNRKFSNSLIIKCPFSQTQNKVSTSVQSFNATLVQNSGRLSFAFTLNNEITYRYPECTTTWILKNGLSQQEIMIISTATHEKCTTKLVDFNPASTKKWHRPKYYKNVWGLQKKRNSATTCHTLKQVKQNATNNLAPFFKSAFNALSVGVLCFAHSVAT